MEVSKVNQLLLSDCLSQDSNQKMYDDLANGLRFFIPTVNQPQQAEVVNPVQATRPAQAIQPVAESHIVAAATPLGPGESMPVSLSLDQVETIETLESRNNLVLMAKEKSRQVELPLEERLKRYEDLGKGWVDKARAQDPHILVEWLKSNEQHIQNGRPELADLPADFTMEDFDQYVKQPFSAVG